MSIQDTDQLRYPIGRFKAKDVYLPEEIQSDINSIEAFPKHLEEVVAGFTTEQFDTPYRPEGWTVRQLIHHLADSHMHAWIRIKWALTEENPTIKAYDEKKYAETPDSRLDSSFSIEFLKTHHLRWAALLKSLTATELQRSFIHPANGNQVSIDRMIQLYSWHGRHHLAHIASLKSRMGW